MKNFYQLVIAFFLLWIPNFLSQLLFVLLDICFRFTKKKINGMKLTIDQEMHLVCKLFVLARCMGKQKKCKIKNFIEKNSQWLFLWCYFLLLCVIDFLYFSPFFLRETHSKIDIVWQFVVLHRKHIHTFK